MKLFQIPRKSKVYCSASDGSEYVVFEKIDGMYSLCVTEKGAIVHLGASTDLEKHQDGYKLS